VVDAGVVYAGAGWRGEAYLSLVALARRRVTAYATVATVEELRDLVKRRAYKCRHDPHTILEWYYRTVRLVDPAPLGKPRSRDSKDDPYLACALGAGAQWIISRDEDLLVLQRPFGISVISPRELLARLA
jgi:predicted nucleic acid-binding protein